MKKLLAFLLLVASSAWAQNFATVTSANILGPSNTPLASGTILFQAVNSAQLPISYQIGGGGQQVNYATVCSITNGAIVQPCLVANVSFTNPLNVCFLVTAKNSKGQVILGGTEASGYACVQPQVSNSWCSTSGGTTTCDFDMYVPNIAGVPIAKVAPPSTLSLGGIYSTPCPNGNVVSGYGTNGQPICVTSGAGSITGATPNQGIAQSGTTLGLQVCDSGNTLISTGISWGCTVATGTGTVTSIGVTPPQGMTVNPSLISTNGTFSFSWNGQIPHSALPTLLASDIPNIAESQVTNLTTDLSNRPTFSFIPGTVASGQVLVGNSGGTAYAPQTISGDCSFNSSGVIICTKTNGVAFAASATTNTTNASNITSGTLPHAQLPALLAGDIPNIAESQVTNLPTDLANRALTSTTVNTHPLSSNVVISASDLTTGTLPHAQLPTLLASDIPNIAESQVTNLTTDLGNRVLTTTTVNGHALSSNVTISASDLTTGTLPHAQLPTLLTSDIPNPLNQNTTGTAGGLLGCPNPAAVAAGSICYSNGSTWNILAGNTTGTELFVAETSGVPSFATTPGSGNVNNQGTPTVGQLPIWQSATVISGVNYLPAGNFPALTGDVTTSQGSLTATVTGVNGAAVPTSKTIVGTNSSGQIVDASSATLANNTTGTAANVTGTVAVAHGGLGTTTAPTSAQIPLGNSGGTAYAPQTLSQDASVTNAGAVTVAGLQAKSLPALSAFTGFPYLTYNGSAWTAANPFASPTFTGTVTLPITGATQCLHVNSSGVVAGVGADCGTGGGSGNVNGPASSSSGDVALFNNTSGTLLSDAGFGFPLANTHLANSTIGIAGTTNQITSSTATPALGGSTTLAIANPFTFPGKFTAAASTTSAASLNIPAGTAPTSPVNGDVWTTTTGVYAQINSATQGPFVSYPSGTGIAAVSSGNSWASVYNASNTIPNNFLGTLASGSNGLGPLATQAALTSKTIVGTGASGLLVDASSATLANNTTGNAATATNISTNGTASQVWGMNSGGSAQGWQTPSSLPSGTQGQPLINTTGVTYTTSPLYLDASQFSGADACAKMTAALTQATTDGGIWVDARSLGSGGDITCANLNFVPSTATGGILLPAGIIHAQSGSLTIPPKFLAMGVGQTAGTVSGAGATVIQACKSGNATCGSTTYPSSTPLVCFGQSGSCGTGNSPVFNSYVEQISADCNSVSGCVAFENFNGQENTYFYMVNGFNWGNAGKCLALGGGSVGSQNSSAEYVNCNIAASATCTTSAVPVDINTGGAANTGPRLVDNLSVTNTGCTANWPTNDILVDGIGIHLHNVHTESYSGSGILIGSRYASSGIEVDGYTSGAATTSGGVAAATISNANASKNILVQSVKAAAGTNPPTDVLVDQLNSNTIVDSTEDAVALYAIGSTGCVVSTSSEVVSKLCDGLTAPAATFTSGDYGASPVSGIFNFTTTATSSTDTSTEVNINIPTTSYHQPLYIGVDAFAQLQVCNNGSTHVGITIIGSSLTCSGVNSSTYSSKFWSTEGSHTSAGTFFDAHTSGFSGSVLRLVSAMSAGSGFNFLTACASGSTSDGSCTTPLFSVNGNGLATLTGGASVPSGATVTIQSGASLVCAAGSTCPTSGLTGLSQYGVLHASSSTAAVSDTPPNLRGLYYESWNLSSDAAAAPAPVQAGFGGRAITGATSTDTVAYTDVNSVINHDVGATTSLTETVPVPTTSVALGGLGNSLFAFQYCNHSTHSDTIAPTTWTIQAGTLPIASTLSVSPGACYRVKIDPNSSTNWLADASGSGVGVPSGTLGNPLVNTNGSTGYATSAIYVDVSQLAGADLCAKTATAVAAATTGQFLMLDARAMGPANSYSNTCNQDPFASLYGTGYAPKVGGNWYVPAGAVVAAQPVVQSSFRVFGTDSYAGGAGGTHWTLSSAVPVAYSATAATAVTTGGSSSTYTFAASPTATPVGHVIPGEIYVQCTTSTLGQSGATCGGSTATTQARGLVTAVTSTTITVETNQAISSTNANTTYFVTYPCAFVLGDISGGPSVFSGFGQELAYMTIDVSSNSTTGAIPVCSYGASNLTTIHDLTLNPYGNAGIDISSNQTQNQNDLYHLWIVDGSVHTSSNSFCALHRGSGVNMGSWHDISCALGGSAGTNFFVLDEEGTYGPKLHCITAGGTACVEANLGTGITLPVTSFASPGNMSGSDIWGVDAAVNSGTLTDIVDIGSAIAVKNVHVHSLLDYASPASAITNLLADAVTGCTVPYNDSSSATGGDFWIDAAGNSRSNFATTSTNCHSATEQVATLVATTAVQVGASAPACTGSGICQTEAANGTNVSGAAMINANSTTHELAAATNGSTSFGMLERVQPGSIHQTGKTAAITTATLCAASAGACNVAGQYHVHFDFIETGTACSSVTAGSVSFQLTWTDTNGTAHSAVTVGVYDQESAAFTNAFHFNTALGTAGASGDFNISTNGAVIQYATAYTACTTGTGTYQLDAAVSRIQ